MKKKIMGFLSFLLVLTLLAGLFPAAMAEDDTGENPGEAVEEIQITEPEPTGIPEEDPAQDPTEDPGEDPAEDPAGEPGEDPEDPGEGEPPEQTEPVTEPVTEPAAEPEETEPAGIPGEDPAEDPAEDLTENPAGEPGEDLTLEPVPGEPLTGEAAPNGGEDQPEPLSDGLTIVEHKQKGIGKVYFTYHYLASDGKYRPVSNPPTRNTSVCSYFTLSDGSTAYCVNPDRPGQNSGGVSVSGWSDYHTPEIREAIAMAIAYGAPNNGDTSDEGKWATALLVWDMGCGYLDKYGQRRNSTLAPAFLTNAKPGTAIMNKYKDILAAIQKGNAVPSFATTSQSNVPEYTLELQTGGYYSLTLTDTNGVLADYVYTSGIAGLTFSQSGNTLTVTATVEAACKLASGMDFCARGKSYNPSASVVVCLRSENWTDATKTQDVVQLSHPIGHTAAYIRLKTNIETAYDPAELKFSKIDPVTGVPQGSASFAGAVFCWEYFPNDDWSGTPERKWYFKTDENGRVEYKSTFLATNDEYASDEMFKDTNGDESIPLGSVRVTEVKSPPGYGVIPTLYANVWFNTEKGKAEFTWTEESREIVQAADGRYLLPEPQDTQSFGGVSVQKLDAATGGAAPGCASFQGIEFTLYNKSPNPVVVEGTTVSPGGVVCVLTLDAGGYAKTGKILPIGSYQMVETRGNDYYDINTEWVKNFNVTGDGITIPLECGDPPRAGRIAVRKLTMTELPLEGATFLLEQSADGVTWTAVGEQTTDASGSAGWTGLHPGLRYRLTETAAPPGYELLRGAAFEGELPVGDFTVTVTVVNAETLTMPATGSIQNLTLTTAGTMLAVAALVCLVGMGMEENKKKRFAMKEEKR